MKALVCCFCFLLGFLTPQDDLEKARALLKEGKIAEAKTMCEQVIQQDPRTPGAREMLDDLNLWINALKEGTAKAVQNYLALSQEHLFQAEAIAALPDLILKDDWEEVAKADKVRKYELFLADHPGSKYEEQARNALARAMADRFRKSTPVAKKEEALSYARDEATREYVDYAYASATGTLDPAVTYRTDPKPLYEANRERKKVVVSVGATALGAIGRHQISYETLSYDPVAGYHTDIKKYPVSDYLAGGGVAVRVGDISKPVNAVFSGSVLMKGRKSEHASDNYRKVVGLLGFDVNWNFYRGERVAFFLSPGVTYELPWWVGVRACAGMGWKHGEWKAGIHFCQSSDRNVFMYPLWETGLCFFF